MKFSFAGAPQSCIDRALPTLPSPLIPRGTTACRGRPCRGQSEASRASNHSSPSAAQSKRHSVAIPAVLPSGVAEAAAETLTQAEQNSLPSATTGGLAALDAAWEPEEFWIPPGKLSPIDRTSDPGEGPAPFRCEGCTRPECQVSPASPLPHSATLRGALHADEKLYCTDYHHLLHKCAASLCTCKSRSTLIQVQLAATCREQRDVLRSIGTTG